jgi:hypothetical protein
MNQARIEADKGIMMAQLQQAKAAPSLTDFAKDIPAPRRCLLCTVPEDVEAQARAGKAAGITYKTIGEWLAHLGYADPEKPPTQARLQRHFQDNHKRSAS